jgi:general secretion pathway protein L
MSGTLFCVDIQDDLVSGVLLQTQTHAIESVLGCASVPIDQRPMGEVVAEVKALSGFQGGSCRVSLAARHFLFRNLTLPFADKRTITKILPFELEETDPIDSTRMVVDTLSEHSQDRKTEIIAAMVERDLLADRLTLLSEFGLDPEILTISGVQTAIQLADYKGRPNDLIMLDLGLGNATMIVVLRGRIMLIRSLCIAKGFSSAPFHFGDSPAEVLLSRPEDITDVGKALVSAIQQTLLAVQIRDPKIPIYLTGPAGQLNELTTYLKKFIDREINHFNLTKQIPLLKIAPAVQSRWNPGVMDNALALGIRPHKGWKGFNFRKDAYQYQTSVNQHPYWNWKIGLSAVLLAAICILGGEYLAKKITLKRLTTRIRTIFSETLPEVSRIENPVPQLQAEINLLKEGGNGLRIGNGLRVLDLLAEISERITPASRVHLTLMVLDERGVRLKGITDTFNTVDTVKKGLEKSPYFHAVTISSASLAPKGDEVVFELKILLSGS